MSIGKTRIKGNKRDKENRNYFFDNYLGQVQVNGQTRLLVVGFAHDRHLS